MRQWTAFRGILQLGLIGLTLTGTASAQDAPAQVVISADRAMVSRAGLQLALQELDAFLASSGYSPAIRAAKEAQAAAIRERLSEGDLRVGDLIIVEVAEVSSLSKTYMVSPTRTISLPGPTEVSVAGILRSELEAHLTTQLKKLVRDPTVRVVPTIRISIFGAVGKPGFINPPATMLLSDVIQQLGGGPSNNVRWNKSQILRGERVVLDGPEFEASVNTATTIDQLNLQAGDVIKVAEKPAGGTFFRILGALSAVTSVIWLGIQIF